MTQQCKDVWVAQVLEGILDDDADMADMYLARRAQLAATSATSATQQRADWDTAPNEHQKSGMHTLLPSMTGFAIRKSIFQRYPSLLHCVYIRIIAVLF